MSVCEAAPPQYFDAEIIAEAMGEEDLRFPDYLSLTEQQRREYQSNPDREYRSLGYSALRTGKAAYFLAVVAHMEPGRRTADGRDVAERVAAHIRSVTAPGASPSARGGIAAWADNSVAHLIAVAHRTPEVWDRLDLITRERAGWLMRALAVAGNYNHNRANNPCTDLWGIYESRKHHNPNHTAYVGVMMAAYDFFGSAATVGDILASFEHEAWINELKRLGLSNVASCWEREGNAVRMARGGPDPAGGTIGADGVRAPFVYERVEWGLEGVLQGTMVPYDPFSLFAAQAHRNYAQSVVSSVGAGGRAGLVDRRLQSPVEGRRGMLFEFASSDKHGLRSSARYAFDGWQNDLINRCTLALLGYWPGGDEARSLQEQFEVGTEDLFFKLAHGYESVANGKVQVHTDASVSSLGMPYLRALYFSCVKRDSPGFRHAHDRWTGPGARVDIDAIDAVYHVSVDGCDESDGASPSRPLRSVAHALRRALGDGVRSRIVLLPGRHVETSPLDLDREGAEKDLCLVIEGASRDTTILSLPTRDPAAGASIDARKKCNVVIRRLTITDAPRRALRVGREWYTVNDITHWRLEDLRVLGNATAPDFLLEGAITIMPMKHLTMRNCEIRDNGNQGLFCVACNFIFENLHVTGNGRNGLPPSSQTAYKGAFSGALERGSVRGCSFIGNRGHGFQTDHVLAEVDFLDCEFSRNGRSGFKAELARGPASLVSCVFEGNLDRGIHLWNAHGVSIQQSRICDNRGSAQVSVTWKERDRKRTDPDAWSLGGAGDLSVPPGAEWTWLHPSFGTRRTLISQCKVQSGAVGETGQSFLIAKSPEDTSPSDYSVWCMAEFTGRMNEYFHPREDSFLCPVGAGEIDSRALAAWIQATGEDESSVWLRVRPE